MVFISFSLPDYLAIPSYDYPGFPLLYRKSANLHDRGREVRRERGREGEEKLSQDKGSESKAGRQSKEGNVNLYGKELARKERKGADNQEKKKNIKSKKPWGKNMRQEVRFEKSQKGGKQSKYQDHTKEMMGANKRKWTKGKNPNGEHQRRGLHEKDGRKRGKVLLQKSRKRNKKGEQKRGGKKGARTKYERGSPSAGDEGFPYSKISAAGGGERIPSKFFQRVKVGSGKEVATVHATQNGRKVKSTCSSNSFGKITSRCRSSFGERRTHSASVR